MQPKPLHEISLSEIMTCFHASFADYAISMPTPLDYWRQRFHAARVDWSHSYGMFDDQMLVGFIIQGVDTVKGVRTAFNTGTGVLPAYRGRQIVDALYAYALPRLRQTGIEKCSLEVLQDNARAIRVYERIGFQIRRGFRCFQGSLKQLDSAAIILRPIPYDLYEATLQPAAERYSWDHQPSAIFQAPDQYAVYEVLAEQGQLIGCFIIHPSTNRLIQYELAVPDTKSNWQLLFAGVQQLTDTIRIINIDESREILIDSVADLGLDNFTDQWEMDVETEGLGE